MKTEKPKLTAEEIIKAVVGSIVALVFVWIFFIPSCDDDNSNVETYSKTDALIQSRMFVEQQLKSPGSAEWCGGTQGVTQLNDTTFLVKSCVDSQNGFGALIRSEYSCRITFNRATNTAFIDELNISSR
jgi:hypothetical protein